MARPDSKRLHLLRHAKSDWDDPELADHDRPLAPRGRRASRAIATHLADKGIDPALVLCSSSARTRETLDRIASALGSPTVEIEDGLYGAGAATLLERLRRVPDTVGSVMVIGHNPGIEELALELAGSGPDVKRMERKYPTAALATLTVPGESWSELAEGRSELVAFVLPRELE
ncbi:MAG: SixA phosphatase family protein [Solirubrobacterales bacterium]